MGQPARVLANVMPRKALIQQAAIARHALLTSCERVAATTCLMKRPEGHDECRSQQNSRSAYT